MQTAYNNSIMCIHQVTMCMSIPPLFSDNAARCSAVFINKGVSVNLTSDTITVEFAGTGPDAQNPVDDFTCFFNDNAMRNCKSYRDTRPSCIIN